MRSTYKTRLVIVGKRLAAVIGLLALVVLFGAPRPSTAQEPSPVTVTVGTSTVAVGASGVVETAIDCPLEGGCSAFAIEIRFDPALIRVDRVEIGPYLGEQPFPAENTTDNERGVVRLAAVAIGARPEFGAPVLLRLYITGQAPGLAALTVTELQVADLMGNEVPAVGLAGAVAVAESSPPTQAPAPTQVPVVPTPVPTLTSPAPVGPEDKLCLTSEPAHVGVMQYPYGFTALDDYMQGAFERFMEACPWITVELVDLEIQSSTELMGYLLNHFERLENGESSGQDLDVVLLLSYDWLGPLAGHLAEPVHITNDQANQYFPALLAHHTVGGRLLALPWMASGGLLYYRVDLLEKYGLGIPSKNWTWDDLGIVAWNIQQGERAEGHDDFWGYVWQGADYAGLAYNALEWQYAEGGGTVIDANGAVQVYNDDTIRALEQAAGWVGIISPPEVVTFMEEDARAVWQAGNAAFMRNWPYAYRMSQRDDFVYRDSFGIAPLPRGASGHGASALAGWSLGISAYAAYPEAAEAVALFLTSYDEQVRLYLDTGNNPATVGVYAEPEVRGAYPEAETLAAAFMDGVLIYPAAESVTVEELYYTVVHRVLTGESIAPEAMAELVSVLAGTLTGR